MSRKKATTTQQPVNETVSKPIPSKEELKDSLLDIYDLEKMFNVKRVTIYNWCNKGTLEFVKIGGRRYFPKADLHKMLESYKQTGVPEERKKNK